MDLEPWRRRLRGALYRSDIDEIMATVAVARPEEALQLIGQGLLAVLEIGHPDAATDAKQCAASLRQRGFPGDEELAAELDSALGLQPVVDLVTLPVDLEELGDALGGPIDGGPSVLDLNSGEVWLALPYGFDDGDPDAAPIDVDEGQRLEVWPEGPQDAYHDMQAFTAGVDDVDLRSRLERSLNGTGAFRRFRDTLDSSPEQVDRWRTFSEDRRIGRGRVWLLAAGYRATPHRRT